MDNNELGTNLAEVGTDCISRQAAIDALCNDYCGGHQDCKYYPNCENLRSVQKLPSAQPEIVRCKDCKLFGNSEQLPSAQPEIIRCKDCKWYGRADKRRFYRGMDCLQKRIDTIVPDRDFCSKAERRTDD